MNPTHCPLCFDPLDISGIEIYTEYFHLCLNCHNFSADFSFGIITSYYVSVRRDKNQTISYLFVDFQTKTCYLSLDDKSRNVNFNFEDNYIYCVCNSLDIFHKLISLKAFC